MRQVALTLLATTALALTGHGPQAVQAAGKNVIHIMPAMPLAPDEQIHDEVKKVQQMSEQTLKTKLQQLFAQPATQEPLMIFFGEYVKAMQKLLNQKLSDEPGVKETADFMNRYAYLFGELVHKYAAFFSLRRHLRDYNLPAEEYRKELVKAEKDAADCMHAGSLMVDYLRLAPEDLRKAYGRLGEGGVRHDMLVFISKLALLFEAVQTHFFTEVSLMRMECPLSGPADLNKLQESRKYRHLKNLSEAMGMEVQRRNKIATGHAKKPVIYKLLPIEYLQLLPYPGPSAEGDLYDPEEAFN